LFIREVIVIEKVGVHISRLIIRVVHPSNCVYTVNSKVKGMCFTVIVIIANGIYSNDNKQQKRQSENSTVASNVSYIA
jgi:hypothetical protein